MKVILTFIVLTLLLTKALAQPCNLFHLTLTSQESVNNFTQVYPGCTTVEGDVFITGDVQNLDSLWPIQKILGSLTISNTASLTSIKGLSHLEEIGSYIRIQHNENLPNLEGLGNLKHIKGDFFYISDNAKMTSIEHLIGIDSIHGIFQIFDMPVLKDLKGLDSLKYLGSDMRLFRIKQLISLKGMEAVSNIKGSLQFYENDSLSDLTALSTNINVGQQLAIYENKNLSSCSTPLLCLLASSQPQKLFVQQNGIDCLSTEDILSKCLVNTHESITTCLFFPNPFQNTIHSPDPSHRTIFVFDLTGKLICSTNVTNGTINLAFLTPGYYIINDGNKNSILQKL